MAEPLTKITSLAVPMLIANIDTDQIIPSREMRSTGKTGLAKGLFAGWRYLPGSDYEIDHEFVLNRPDFADAKIILAGENFGCGSSREHAVWALAEYGIRVVIAPSFAPIFEGNCARNGVLCVRLSSDTIDTLSSLNTPIAIDLPAQTVSSSSGEIWRFELDEEAKAMLVGGLDAIALTLQHKGVIAQWQSADQTERPWIYL